jgi:aryl carrier-like protein
LRDLLHAAVADPDVPLSRLAAFPEAERRQLVATPGAIPSAVPSAVPDPEEAAWIPPRDELERTLCAAWGEVLGRDRIGVRESFFEIGGNSLAMIRLHSRLCQALGREIAIATLFQHPTIESLAQHLSEETPRPEEDARERTEIRRQALRELQQARGHLRRHRSSRGSTR